VIASLHTITDLPLDRGFPLFRHYSAMKLGVRDAVRFYARALAPLAQTILAGDDWVLTAPPLYVIPSAANLIAAHLSAILGVRTVDVRYAKPYPQFIGDEYSRTGLADRIANRRMLHEGEFAPKPSEDDFGGRAVLVVNDIHVTGVQQEYLQRTLETAHPSRICWMYIIQVAPPLGRAHPEIEYQLNHLDVATFAQFAEVLTRADIDYTARCITRILGASDADLEMLLQSLSVERRRRLHRLMTEEGAYAAHQERVDRFLA
jgi:hypothetical protein